VPTPRYRCESNYQFEGAERVKVEIWSDVVCPWCYIGKRRFESALARFEDAASVDVEWKSFQLNPEQPKGSPEAHDAYLVRRMGADLDQIRAMDARIVELAAAEGLDYHFDTYRVVNTFDAHRVLQLAKSHGLGTEAHERLLRAQLVEGELLEDPDTLVRLAVEVGVPEDAAQAVVTGDAFADAVRADLREAAGLGISGVPFFVFDRTYGVSGAQAADTFLAVLEKVVAERAQD
jgi:predicted DsbA family dithiol-disulfide isomerase